MIKTKQTLLLLEAPSISEVQKAAKAEKERLAEVTLKGRADVFLQPQAQHLGGATRTSLDCHLHPQGLVCTACYKVPCDDCAVPRNYLGVQSALCPFTKTECKLIRPSEDGDETVAELHSWFGINPAHCEEKRSVPARL